jgi:KipI family sensor histidine kinase inhibitor
MPYGDRALLVELDSGQAVLELRAAIRTAITGGGLKGVGELVPAARTLLVHVDPAVMGLAALTAALTALPRAPAQSEPTAQVVIPVYYDGADLGAVAQQTGLSEAEVITRHTAARYTVAFCGFSPGFAYLSGLDPALHLPRLPTPRTAVPAGSVAIAADYAGIYPRTSPGGWRLLGRTEVTLWDLARTPPALLSPGTEVRFEAQ